MKTKKEKILKSFAGTNTKKEKIRNPEIDVNKKKICPESFWQSEIKYWVVFGRNTHRFTFYCNLLDGFDAKLDTFRICNTFRINRWTKKIKNSQNHMEVFLKISEFAYDYRTETRIIFFYRHIFNRKTLFPYQIS